MPRPPAGPQRQQEPLAPAREAVEGFARDPAVVVDAGRCTEVPASVARGRVEQAGEDEPLGMMATVLLPTILPTSLMAEALPLPMPPIVGNRVAEPRYHNVVPKSAASPAPEMPTTCVALLSARPELSVPSTGASSVKACCTTPRSEADTSSPVTLASAFDASASALASGLSSPPPPQAASASGASPDITKVLRCMAAPRR